MAASNGIGLAIAACVCLWIAPAFADAGILRQQTAASDSSTEFSAGGGSETSTKQLPIILVGDSDRGNYLTDQKLNRTVEPREQRKARPVQRSTSRSKSQQAKAKTRQSVPVGKSIPGEYRTVCVRTCDGYYFPMSFASSRRQFSRDLRNCQAMCPGTEMQVFFQENDAQMVEEVKEGEEAPDIRNESADMISVVNGKPYSEMPTAYLYRRESLARPANCSCDGQGSSEAVAETAPSNEATSSTSPAAALVKEPDPPVDPKISTELGDDQAKDVTVRTQESGEMTARPLEPERKVRVVGPEFLPDPEGAIDLRAPAKRYVP
ncbi:DUF2865 domain-containing protein [Mesorhizobium sp. YR577]|uniref:DUF2865 domain-containing protein n=1 Tax=Mesorhizobium sp. YR577 TaxID=1884373 RepID=UPI0008E5D8AC|nr:DUF2865 domain-containing protein [Mesorhizobium sp. YR577]SFU23434.1 Protein of unknown function [Mesorhizobium sp. YR577]